MTANILPATWTIVFTSPSKDKGAAALYELAGEKQWRAAKDQILAFTKFGYDWDSYESLAPDSLLLHRALSFLEGLRLRHPAPPSRVALSPSGNIAIEWHQSGTCVQAEIGADKIIEWVEFAPGQKPTHWTEESMIGHNSRSDSWTGRAILEDDAVSAAAL